MALADTGKAISAVTDAVRDRLFSRSGIDVTVGRPEQDQGNNRLNLFLYEIVFDASMKNISLDEGQPPPLWLVLKYLLTAYDNDKESNSIEAHEFLGVGVRVLQGLNFLAKDTLLNADYVKALETNPEELKITFDETPPDLVSKIMQGGGDNESYRVAVAFQVRPVLIAPEEPASYSLLVGVDYTTPPTPPTTIGEKGIHIPILPSMGPTITKIEPAGFEADDTVTVHGTDLHLSNLSVRLGPVELPVVMQRPDQLKVKVRKELVTGDLISAGGQPVTVVQAVTLTRRRASNPLIGNLLPTVTSATVLASAAGPEPGTIVATIELGGLLLGDDADDVFLALYKDGQTVRVLDAFMTEADIPGPDEPPQTRKRVEMQPAEAVPAGTYLAILRVNGVQAKQSLAINLV
jgi:Pvc16 N-terminal domain